MKRLYQPFNDCERTEKKDLLLLLGLDLFHPSGSTKKLLDRQGQSGSLVG
jgi:hypothetical protein